MKKHLSAFLSVMLLLALCIGALFSCSGGEFKATDKASNVSVEGGGFNKGASLQVEKITDDNKIYDIMDLLMNEDYENSDGLVAFDISVSAGGTSAQPAQKVKISIPAPNDYVKSFLIFCISGDKATRLDCELSDGMITFESDTLATFAVASHTHTFSTEWRSDDTHHWQEASCGCNIKKYNNAHTFDKGIISVRPTDAAPGVYTYTCKACEYKKNEELLKKDDQIIVFGDSYSTYKGYIPNGYGSYYPYEKVLDVTDVSMTWWHLLAEATESEILLNESWSGSTVCNMGYNGDCSKTSSFIFRLENLIGSGYFDRNQVGKVVVFGGTNDAWIHTTEAGEPKYSDWTAEDLNKPLPAYCYFIGTLLKVVPKEDIHVVINSDLGEGFEQLYEDGYAEICQHYGITYTQLENIEKLEDHPTKSGMAAIKDQILEDWN